MSNKMYRSDFTSRRLIWLKGPTRPTPPSPEEKLYKETLSQGTKTLLEKQKALGDRFDLENALTEVVNEIESRRVIHIDQLLRIRRDLHQQFEQLKKTAKSSEEANVLNELSEHVVKIDDKYIPRGLDPDFKAIRVHRKDSWSKEDLVKEGGAARFLFLKRKWWGLVDKVEQIWGNSVDAKRFNVLMNELPNDIKALEMAKAELAFLKRTKEKNYNLRTMLSEKRFLDIIWADIDKDIAVTEAQRKIVTVSNKVAELTRRVKEKRAVIDAVLKRTSADYEFNKKLFSETVVPMFQPEIQKLRQDRPGLNRDEFTARKDKLKVEMAAKVLDLSGTSYDFTKFDSFFEELFEPDAAEKKRQEQHEKLEHAVMVKQLLENTVSDTINDTFVDQVAEELRKKYPQGLELFMDPEEWEKALQLLFKGSDGTNTLPLERRLLPTVQNIVTTFERLQWYSRYSGGKKLADILAIFANEWKGVKAQDFDKVFDRIVAGRAPSPKEAGSGAPSDGSAPAPAGAPSAGTPPAGAAPAGAPPTPTAAPPDPAKERLNAEKNILGAVWQFITGSPADTLDTNALHTELESNADLKKFYILTVRRKPSYRQLMKVFFLGEFDDTPDGRWVGNTDLLVEQLDPSANVDAFLKVLDLVKTITALTNNPNHWKKIIELFIENHRAAPENLYNMEKTEIEHLYEMVNPAPAPVPPVAGTPPTSPTPSTPPASTPPAGATPTPAPSAGTSPGPGTPDPAPTAAADSAPKSPEDLEKDILSNIWKKVTGETADSMDMAFLYDQLKSEIQADNALRKFYTRKFLQSEHYQQLMRVFFTGYYHGTDDQEWIIGTRFLSESTTINFIKILKLIHYFNSLSLTLEECKKVLVLYTEENANTSKNFADLTEEDITKLLGEIRRPSGATVVTSSPDVSSSAPMPGASATPTPVASATPTPETTSVESTVEKNTEQLVEESIIKLYKLVTAEEISQEEAKDILTHIKGNKEILLLYLKEFYRQPATTSPYLEVMKIFFTGLTSDGERLLNKRVVPTPENFMTLLQIIRNLDLMSMVSKNKDALKAYLKSYIETQKLTTEDSAFYLKKILEATTPSGTGMRIKI